VLARVAAAALLAVALAPPARAQAPETIALIAPDGSCSLRAAPAGTLEAMTAELTAAAEELRGIAARLLVDAATMRMAPARERVPLFGDWAYSWVQSYVTSYRVLARGAMGLADSLAGRGELPSVAHIADEMAAPIRGEFRTRVLSPSLDDGGFAQDLEHVGQAIDRGWDRALRDAAARLQALPMAEGRAAERLDLSRSRQPMAPLLVASLPADPLALVSEEGADTTMVFTRSMRPMAARLGAVLVRISEAGSLVATGGAFGYALAGVPGTAAGLVGGIGASWAIDWAFNRVDASLNRRAFEAQALAALDRAEDRLAQDSAGAARAALVMRLGALRPGPGGCP
jgi:hypothetical protein